MTVNAIPQPGHPITGNQRIDPTWYRYLRELDREARDTGTDLSAEIEAIARKLGSPDGTIDGIPETSVEGLFPIVVDGGRVTLSTVTAGAGGELLGLTTDQWGRINAVRPVVAGVGITIDGATVPEQIEIINGNPNVLTTLGDLVRAAVDGVPERLPVGTEGQVLTVVSGEPEWAAAPGGLSNPMTTAEDLIVGGASGVPARLPVGTDGQVLTVTAGAVDWATPSGLSNPMTTSGDIITGGASGVPQRLAAGTDGHVLTLVSGAPAWAAASGGGGGYPAKWRGAYTAVATTTTITTYNLPALQTVFTLTFGAISGTNAFTSRPRVGTNNVAASTSAVGGFRSQAAYVLTSTAAGIGGFKHRFIMGVGVGADVSTHRLFIGLNGSNAAPTDVEPSSRVNVVGIGYDSADANLQFIHNDASGTATKVDLGAGLPKPSVVDETMYQLELESPDGSGVINYTVTDLGTGNSASGTASTDLPVGSMGFWAAMTAGGVTSTSVRLWLSNVEVEV